MRDIDISNYLGKMPRITLVAYDVSINSAGYRTLTSHSAYDIAPEYIDMDSIHFEWAQCPGDTFEPGGCIPSHLEIKLLSSYAGDNPLTPTYTPTSASDYSVLYKMLISYAGVGGSIYYYGAPMILVSKSSMRNSKSVKLVFEDELTIFNNMFFDISNTAWTYNTILQMIISEAKIGDITGLSNIVNGANYAQQGELSARQILSYILQANGCFMSIDTEGAIVIKPLRTSTNVVGQLSADYVMDYSFGECEGKWDHALMIVDGDPITYSPGNYPNTYLFRNNPLVVEGNKSTYSNILTRRVSGVKRAGLEVKYAFHQAIEPGDYLQILYRNSANPSSYSRKAIISRITWDGGAFFTLKECEFDRFNML